MNKHTPGPWQIADGESRRVYLINHGRDAVGETVYIETRNPADAKLIAAAPDLLEALESMLDAFTDERWVAVPIIERAKLAIYRATGEEYEHSN